MNKILIIEDDLEINALLADFLKEKGYAVHCQYDGLHVLDFLNKEKIDLIILDIMLPYRSGDIILSDVRKKSTIPVIIISAKETTQNKIDLLRLGADDYITKPFDISLLEQRIKSLMRNREIVRERALKLIKPENDEQQVILANELNDQFVKKAVEVIHNNMQNLDFDKESFAMEMHVSGSLLYKKIKALTGQSPIDFIKSIRLNRALELLQSHKYTITEVSELCGYSSISYFSTVFKKYFGKSPTEV